MSKISVIIPIYNVEKYLKECLDSVVNQTFKDIEIICVDDCGTDNSIQIAEEYAKKDERIKIIHHETNKGLAISRNTGMDNASGEYIFFLDSDDYILPNILEKLYENICTTQADIVLSRPIAFADDNNNKNIIRRTEEMNDWIEKYKTGYYQICIDNYISLTNKILVTAWGKLYKKDFLEKNHLRFIEKKVIHEDEGFWLKVCSCFPIVIYIEDIGIMYRIRNDSIMDLRKNEQSNHDFLCNVKDAAEYFCKYRKKYAKEFIKQIKNNEYYCYFFEKKLSFLYRYRWFENNKVIAILGIPIYREKITKNNKKIVRILGIPVYWKAIGEKNNDT